jgi:hypothetical protein
VVTEYAAQRLMFEGFALETPPPVPPPAAPKIELPPPPLQVLLVRNQHHQRRQIRRYDRWSRLPDCPSHNDSNQSKNELSRGSVS